MTKFDFKVGDKVRLTGRDWDRVDHGVSAGDVVEISSTSWRYPEFYSSQGAFYIWSKSEGDYGAELVQAAEDNAISPDHYKFGDVQVRDISGHLTSFGGQALQYVARATRLDGQNKGNPVEDLKKARRLLKWEIKRLEAQE